MKAVLVIDMPVALEHLIGEDMILQISAKSDGHYIMTEYAMLRPMPKRKLHEYEQVDDEYGYVEGWNACIDAIIGEKNDKIYE